MKLKNVIILGLNMIFIVFLVTKCTIQHSNERQETLKITHKEALPNGNYLILGENRWGGKRELIIKDEYVGWRFNSTTLYNDIKVDSTQTLTIHGKRWEFASWYPRIIEVQ